MNVAFIPVRGGSKSIPLKNIREIAGYPLVYWVTKAACGCANIDKVYIATDSEIIKQTVESFRLDKVNVIGRGENTASDTASTESAMLEFAGNYDFDNIVLIQATSPLLTAKDLDNGFEIYNSPNTDSVISVVRQKRFNWEKDELGQVHPINYDVYNRPRRQEFDGYLSENGAFYITSKKALVNSQNRVSGKIKQCEMPEETFYEIDEPSDWIIIEQLLRLRNAGEKLHHIPEIKMFLTDCDGCLTDGGMYYSEQGDELKKFNTKDGMAFGLLKEKGIITGIVTGENVQLNVRRAKKLNLDICEIGCMNKADKIMELSKTWNIPLNEILYVGDDINDLEALRLAGYSCCPADAVETVRNSVDYVTNVNGGNGVIREIVDKILKKLRIYDFV